MIRFSNTNYECLARRVTIAFALVLAGCATRPTAAVLEPKSIVGTATKQVSLLAATNRGWEDGSGGFGNKWATTVTYEQYGFTVPPRTENAAVTYPSTKPDAKKQFVVTRRTKLSRQQFIKEANHIAMSDGMVVVFVHGYNYSYQEALFRTAQMAADAPASNPPIVFSWPSAATVTGYVADRDAVLHSRSELVDLIEALAKGKHVKRVVLFGHSMGGFLSMEAVRQLRLQRSVSVLNKLQVVLASPDIDVDVFGSQLRDIGRMPSPITLLVSRSDSALRLSSFIGGERRRVGLVNIDDPLVKEATKADHLVVIDITSAKASDGLGHDRYAALAKFSGELARFDRRKFSAGETVGAFVFDLQQQSLLRIKD